MPESTLIEKIIGNDKIDWLLEKELKLIISPDSDGFLCGLLYANLMDASIVGYYDGKILILKRGLSLGDCAFLDMEIASKSVRSCGHHMMAYSQKSYKNLNDFSKMINPNNLMNYNASKHFQKKYPFATIHFLLSVLQAKGHLDSYSLQVDSIPVLLFTDGTWNNLFGYTENCLEWIKQLGWLDKGSILNQLVQSNTTIHQTMEAMNGLLRKRDESNAEGYFYQDKYEEKKSSRTGDKFRISTRNGNHVKPINLEVTSNDVYRTHCKEKERIVAFYSYVAKCMNWSFDITKWSFDDFKLYAFNKGVLGGSNGRRLNNKSYSDLIDGGKVISMAITAGKRLEYSEDPDCHIIQ